MDTALFYPAYLGLSSHQAKGLLDRMVGNMVELGGCMTTNWHDRSLAPERMWGACYRELIAELKERKAWFATAGQATSWFQKRRAVKFGSGDAGPHGASLGAALAPEDALPGLRLRVHNVQESSKLGTRGQVGYLDIVFDESVDSRTLCGVGK
jgi:hypothetical protein